MGSSHECAFTVIVGLVVPMGEGSFGQGGAGLFCQVGQSPSLPPPPPLSPLSLPLFSYLHLSRPDMSPLHALSGERERERERERKRREAVSLRVLSLLGSLTAFWNRGRRVWAGGLCFTTAACPRNPCLPLDFFWRNLSAKEVCLSACWIKHSSLYHIIPIYRTVSHLSKQRNYYTG